MWLFFTCCQLIWCYFNPNFSVFIQGKTFSIWLKCHHCSICVWEKRSIYITSFSSISYWSTNIVLLSSDFHWGNKEGWRQISRPKLRPLSTYIMENRIRHASSPVHAPIPLHLYVHISLIYLNNRKMSINLDNIAIYEIWYFFLVYIRWIFSQYSELVFFYFVL